MESPCSSEPLLEPAAREMQHRVLARQALAEFRHERTGQGEIGLRHVRDHDDEVGRIFLRHLLQPIHPHVRQIAIVPGDGQAGGDALQILNQPQPQHDRNGPELAQFQSGHRLVSGDEGASAMPHRSAHPHARSIRARCHKRAGSPAEGPLVRRGNSRLYPRGRCRRAI